MAVPNESLGLNSISGDRKFLVFLEFEFYDDQVEKPKIAVLDDYDGSIAKLGCWSTLKEQFKIAFYSKAIDSSSLSDVEVIVAVRERTPITSEFLQSAPALKHLALTGRFSGQADLETLKKMGVAVSCTDGSGAAPAELTIALIIAASKGIVERHHEVRSGGWQCGPATMLAGKTLGILGLGRVGSVVAQFGKLMNMNVIAWGPTPDHGRSERLGVQRLALKDVLSRADIISVNLRLSSKTRDLLAAQEFSTLKDGVLLVNTARAEIAEKAALYAELRSGRISAALDVFHAEPLHTEDPLRKFPNVLLSPHMGYVTHEVYETFFSQVTENIAAWKAGQQYKNVFEA